MSAARASRPGGPAFLLAALALAATVGVGALAANLGPSPSVAPAGSPSASAPAASPAPTPSPSPSPTPEPTPTPVAVVPVTSFRSPVTGVGLATLLAGEGPPSPFRGLVLVERDAPGILAALGADAAGLGERLRTVSDAAALGAALAADRTLLGFLRADEVGPSVRALAWEGVQLFGVARVRDLAAWPLRAALPEPAAVSAASPAPSPSASAALGTAASPAATPGPDPFAVTAAPYDPGAAWTLVAAGDILLDRGVELAIRDAAAGADFPFDGGTAEITGRRCCSSFGWRVPTLRRTGDEGAVRALLSGADLAIANFENPAPVRYRFHARGTVFSANPARIDGLVAAGLDWVSLANNHIGDAGRKGILETIAALDARGLRHGGAGGNLRAAREPALLDAGGVTVAVLAYDQIAAYYHATETVGGSAPLTARFVREDVAAARAAGADVVVVFPHWGVEYTAKPSASQVRLARAAIDAGADLVVGNHPHWAGAMEVYRGKPIWYALGNFVFDQTWSEPTMQGLTLELTFRGATLVQADMRPHVIVGKAQPNFLDPAGDGAVVMDQVFEASAGRLPW